MRLADAPAAAGAPDKLLVVRGGLVRSRDLPAAAADLAAGGLLGAAWGRLLLVSPAGDDGDAAAGNPLRPYRTLEAAQAAAAAGDVIQPTAGAYAPPLTLGKDGVSWRLPAGVTVAAPAGQPAFAAGPGLTYWVAGPGAVSGSGPTVVLVNGGALTLDGLAVRNTGAGSAARLDSGTLALPGCGVLWTASGPCIDGAGAVPLSVYFGHWRARLAPAGELVAGGVLEVNGGLP